MLHQSPIGMCASAVFLRAGERTAQRGGDRTAQVDVLTPCFAIRLAAGHVGERARDNLD